MEIELNKRTKMEVNQTGVEVLLSIPIRTHLTKEILKSLPHFVQYPYSK